MYKTVPVKTQNRKKHSVLIQSDSPAATHSLGVRLAQNLRPGLLITLRGDLGSGKTTLTQGIAEGLGIHQQITSPTFTLIHEYQTRQGWRLVHVDGYRLLPLNSEDISEEINNGDMNDEAMTIGIEDALADDNAIVVVEWPQGLLHYLPDERLAIDLLYGEAEETRLLTLSAYGEIPIAVLQPFQRQ